MGWLARQDYRFISIQCIFLFLENENCCLNKPKFKWTHIPIATVWTWPCSFPSPPTVCLNGCHDWTVLAWDSNLPNKPPLVCKPASTLIDTNATCAITNAANKASHQIIIAHSDPSPKLATPRCKQNIITWIIHYVFSALRNVQYINAPAKVTAWQNFSRRCLVENYHIIQKVK